MPARCSARSSVRVDATVFFAPKGYENSESDIDVAVIIPTLEGDWLKLSIALNRNVRKVNLRIEPVLMIESQWSPLYEDVMLTGIAV